jgi:3-oxoacyl-[acyl-carrier-protein] synthase III
MNSSAQEDPPGQRVLLQGVGGGFTWGSSVVTL